MIKKHSDDPDVEAAAAQALTQVHDVLSNLAAADSFDYGGHILHLGEYSVCTRCTRPIAEAQQAAQALRKRAEAIDDPVVKEHLDVAARFFELEAETAIVRAELHNGFGSSEQILNNLLAFQYDRAIHDSYDHSHHQGK